METNKEESILHEPLLPRPEASCGREGATPARVGSSSQGDGEEEGRETFTSSLNSDVCSWAAALGEFGRV